MRNCIPLLLAIAALPVSAQWNIPWSYGGPRGPEHWGELDAEYAACNGKAQSPIDIRSAQKGDLPALRFAYRSSPLKYLLNNGKTIRVNYHTPLDGGYLEVGAKRYQLTQFHFHRPAEELIHGKQYAMVAHLMHQADDGTVAGVAVLLQPGEASSTVARLWAHLPKTEGAEEEVPGVEVNPTGLLPRDTGYYTYMGSLSAPPCTEGVVWFVLKSPVEMSREQIALFAKLYPHDVRPPQPLHGRVVRQSR